MPAQFRAVWIAEDGHKTLGTLTDKAEAIAQVIFLEKCRKVWLEDEKGNRIEL